MKDNKLSNIISILSLIVAIIAVVITVISNAKNNKKYVNSLKPMLAFKLYEKNGFLVLSIKNNGQSEATNININFLELNNNEKSEFILDDIFKKVDVETIAAMNLFAGTDIEYEEKEEVINVCKAWEDHKKLGIQQGENKMLFTLVTKGKLDIDTAAEEAGVSVSEFEKLMSEAGYKVPETV